MPDRAGTLFDAGVKEYRAAGYWRPDYTPRDTDVLAAFRVTPQADVPPEEAAAAVAAESSTGTWTTVWTDRLTDLDRYKAKCYRIEPVGGDDGQYIAYVAYDLDLFEEGSVANMASSIVGNVFGFKALRALRLEDLRIPAAYLKTFQGPPHGIRVERDRLDKYGRPLLGCTIKPKLGLSARNYGRAVYECLRGGLDFTKDDENINSQPFMRWRDRFEFVMEAVTKAEGETGERKGHYLNVTAPDYEQMIERASFAKELGSPIIMLDYLTAGFTAHTSLSRWCRANGLLLHCHRAMHAVLDRQRNHGIHWRVLAKWCRMIGADHLHNGTVVGKLEGDRAATMAINDLSCARTSSPPTRPGASTSTSRGRRCPRCSRWLPAASTSGTCPTWSTSSATTRSSSSAAAPSATPGATPPGATANRVALEAVVQARNEGRELAVEGPEILRRAAKASPELDAALEVWQETTFEFEPVDRLDPSEARS